MKNKIGISYTELSFQNYWDWFTPDDLGDEVELVELSFIKNNEEAIQSCDGFVLTGGVDVHPSVYGGAEDYPNKTDPLLQQRDSFEQKIFLYAKQHQLPVLAICRGLQLVNVLQGGRLVQDLGDSNQQHRRERGADKKHLISIAKTSLLHSIVGESAGVVNSAHHQSADTAAIGEDLMVSAVANDGTIEAIEWKDKSGKAFLLCVQWHPERMEAKEKSPLSRNCKAAFLNAVKNTTMKKLTIINPATEEEIAAVNQDNESTLQQKLKQLQMGQKRWQEVPLSERVTILQRFSSLLKDNSESLAAILTSEMGKPLQQSRNEIAGACKRIHWLTSHAESYLREELMTDEDGMQEKIVYEPLGVVCNISAWNYPYLVGVNVFVPALLAGNAVLYKPSEYATLTGLQIEKWLKEAGVPDDVFQVAVGAGEVGEVLLDLPLDGYFFTGSYKTGQYIYERVAPKMVPCQLELGGKDPLYVADDVADIKAVAAATADGAFYNNGQSCCAVERIYVHQSIYQQYLDAFVAEVKGFAIGQPTEEGIYIGPLSRKDQLLFLEQQVAEAKEKGATVLTGGNKVEGQGFYFQPTVLADVNHSMRIMKEESFGPLIGIMKVESDDEAVHMMQDTEYGLTAAVYSKSKERAEAILKQLDTGTVYWNCCDRVSAAVPWSGRKHSGFGATLSHAGLRAFTRPKAYHLRGV
ncbi:MAG TPA: aldehyde dehydrogenase family protein [Flavisolibacter sp.]|jgi:acyl-CoA reductase-like NAD-dependent aldehyde dehydrogenase/gamma-glutamyl-gamma-aminobutyrate hydrolase PuuD|nr:aldehyde dehydrogenase family protein [Flavisolibacter sp.]